jgi:abortive infection bacteriophage resistance protein
MAYEHPWKSFEDQLGLLESRGLEVTDRSKALQHLQRIGYYRLKGYWHPFRQRTGIACPVPSVHGKPTRKEKQAQRFPTDDFKPGLSFQNAVDLYVFDKRLRLLVLDAIERIEVALRVDIAHLLGQLDTFAYLRPELLHEDFAVTINPKTGMTEHHDWLANHARLLQRSKEPFIQHNKDKYGYPIAIWIACEVWDFGCMSRLFVGMKHEHQDQVAARYGIKNGGVFASWLASLNYLRNVCAHHSRLWNRNITRQPKRPAPAEALLFQDAWTDTHKQARPFLLLCIVQHILCTINPTSSWWQRLMELLKEFPDFGGSDAELSLDAFGIVHGYTGWNWQDNA